MDESPRRLDMRIKQKMILSYLFLLLLIVAFLFTYFPARQKNQLERELNNKLISMTDMVAVGIGVGLSTGDNAIFKETITWVKSDTDLAYILLLDDENEELISYNPRQLDATPTATLTDGQLTTFDHIVYLAQPIEHDDITHGRAIIGLSRDRLQREINEETWISIIVSLAMLILGTAIVWLLSKLIGGPIVEMKEVAIRLADGETDVSVPAVRSGGEVGDLAAAFRTMQENLRLVATQAQAIAQGDLSQAVEMRGDLADAFNHMVGDLSQLVRQMQEAGRRIGTSSARISDAIMEQSGTATQQYASISDTAATMEELTSITEEIQHSSNRVVEAAAGTRQDAENGVGALRVTLERMQEIGEANEKSIGEIQTLSEKVGQVNGVMDIINNITDQTKLIAFNAAIEAVAAGEFGKRFGVVAQEIRRLADTVVDATEDIRQQLVEIQEATQSMVNASQDNTLVINRSMESANVTADSLEQILQSARSTAESVDQISHAIGEQGNSVERVMISLKDISDGAQQFAQTVEGTNLVATDMNSLSNELSALIGRFKVESAAPSKHDGDNGQADPAKAELSQ